jgi:hypothetical protein
MTTSSRLNNLILNQDWTRIYQTFKNADFKSYDFENLRRVIIEYIRENYPEDFNDYIESSEYLALIDAIAFLGQSLSFRIDLASRENFIELAERKDSVLRLARMLSYNSKRNIGASGLLKFDTITTTENILDSNGRNLSLQNIIWNDPTNPNWNEQFIVILNSAMADNTEIGRSQGSAVIQGIQTEQYRLRSNNRDVPVYAYTKNVASKTMAFEIVSTTFKNKEYIYEEAPYPANQLGFVYRNDGKGPGSANNGFFLMFKQGSLELADFTISIPTSNEKVAIDTAGINNDDIWLFSLDSNGLQTSQWARVPAVSGNNIAYNSLTNGIRDIYSVTTRDQDKIDLQFSDGIYGNLPQGNLRVYYRVSNGLSYNIIPNDMRGISVSFPYVNKSGEKHTLTVNMSLKYTVTGSTPSETIDSIRQKAPASFYTQNRMITAEDYNLAPLTTSQDILKVKAINRTSSGISRNFEIIDASGNYSSVEVYADDGLLYKNQNEIQLGFKFTNRIDILNFIKNSIEPIFEKSDVFNFYLTKYGKINFIDDTTIWRDVASDNFRSTGYFESTVDETILKTGVYTNNTLKYFTVGSLIKFIPKSGYIFNKKNEMLALSLVPEKERKQYIWTKAVNIVGDGTNAGRGVLISGLGPVQFGDIIPDGAVASKILPKFVSNLNSVLETEIADLVLENLNFGLRYDIQESSWKIISSGNLNIVDDFTLGKTGDTTNSNLDSSWIIVFIKEPDRYVIKIRIMEYIFGSIQKNRFYIDVNQRVYDSRNNRVVKDTVKILGINRDYTETTELKTDYIFEISDTIKLEDGYESDSQIKLSFSDSDNDGIIDDPDQFEQIVGIDEARNFLFFQYQTKGSAVGTYQYIDNTGGLIKSIQKESLVDLTDTINYPDGQLIYFYDANEDVIKRVDRTNNTLVFESTYRANIGRSDIKFQYIHNANSDRRIDPSVSNIVDVYILPKSYDTSYRNYILGTVAVEPTAPTSDALRINFGSNLDLIKSISDEIIYHPVKYKILFGTKADPKLQAVMKVVKNPNKSISDNDLKVRIVNSINEFFQINNWDFGDRFYLGELITYVITQTVPDISNIVVVPSQPEQVFGSLFEVQSRPDELFVSGITVDDIELVSSISAAEINANMLQIVNTTS